MAEGRIPELIGKRAAPGAPAEKPRLVARLTQEFLLRSLMAAAELHGGDIVRTIVCLTIIAANTSHLNASHGTTSRFDDMDNVPPDSERRPISVLALSKSLGMPFETTRRHVNALIAAGYCVRVSGGLIVPAAVIASAENTRLLLFAVANARRFARDLARHEAFRD